LNHYIEFSSLDDAYLELASRFLVLEGAIDYATNLCPDNAEFYQTGFDLCDKVIKAPGVYASSAQNAATASMVFNTIAGNKYSAKTATDEMTKARNRRNQINEFAIKIKNVKAKYAEGLVKLGILEDHTVDSVSTQFVDVELEKFKKMKKENLIVFLCILIICIIPLFNDNLSDDPKNPALSILVIYGLYFFFSLNKRSKRYFGESWTQALKRFKNK